MADIKGTLSMCRRAGKLIGGMDEVKACCRKKEARCVLVASDFSEKSRREIAFECERSKTPLLDIPDTMFDIADAIGKRYGVMAITDKGFAEAVMKKI